MSIFLAIETSQRQAGIAVRDQRGEVHLEMLSQVKRHDDDLMPAIDRLFKRFGLTPNDLRGGAVAVSIGPGGFTGLRIAVATAKVMGDVLGARIVAVPSSLVAAASLAHPWQTILVALACKTDSCWITKIGRDSSASEWRIIETPGIHTSETVDLTNVDALLGDEFLPDSWRVRCEQQHVSIVAPVFDPRACLQVGEAMLARHETTDPLMLSPLYPREPEAVTLWNQKHPEKPPI